jgi:hypothetical protein
MDCDVWPATTSAFKMGNDGSARSQLRGEKRRRVSLGEAYGRAVTQRLGISRRRARKTESWHGPRGVQRHFVSNVVFNPAHAHSQIVHDSLDTRPT